MTPSSLYRYMVHGLVLCSDFEIPELAERSVEDTTAAQDVRIRLGEIEASGTPVSSIVWSYPKSGAGVVFNVPGAVRYLVRDGRDVIVQPFGTDWPLIRTFLFGPIAAMLCLQRGAVALHASAVAFGDQVVAFVGDQGAGKSTLAAHCLKLGAVLMADDLLRVELTGDGQACCHPGMPHLKLSRQAIGGLGLDARTASPLWWREDKLLVPFVSMPPRMARPLARVYMLARCESAQQDVTEQLTGAAAVTALIDNSHCLLAMDATGRRMQHFHQCVELSKHIQVVRLLRCRDASRLPQTAALVASACASERRAP